MKSWRMKFSDGRIVYTTERALRRIMAATGAVDVPDNVNFCWI